MFCVHPASIPWRYADAYGTTAVCRVCNVSCVLPPFSANVTVVSPSRMGLSFASTAMLVKTSRPGLTIS
jgi:hypothetical protein